MLHLIYGDDREEKKKEATRIRSLGFAEHFVFDADTVEVDRIIELATARPLFGGSMHIEIFDALAVRDCRAILLSVMSTLAASPNTFVFVETKALKETTDAFKEAKAKIIHCEAKKVQTTPEFNSFALTDAVASRDKKLSWVLYQKALLAGKSPEELSGLIFWQLKNLLLVKSSGAAATLGMKPFVYTKSQTLAKKWEQSELEALSASLVTATHEPRRGIVDADLALERVILSEI